MRHAIRLAVTAGLALGLLGTAGPAPANTVRQASAAQPQPGIFGADAEFRSEIEAAIDRYESNGLELPPLRIFVHATNTGCQGHLGTYGQYGERDRLDLCTEAKFYVLHELAHAWEQNTFSEEDRQIVLLRIGREVWHDRNIPWLDSGAEVVANNIAWGLMDEPLSEQDLIWHEDQLDRFRLLTGAISPRIE